MFIYRIYNIDTNESYIGQTAKSVEYRFKEHIREAKRALRGERQNFPLFHRLLLYHGVENFKCELLEDVSNEQADEREMYWIEYFDSYNSGYNSTRGGQNRPMSELNKESTAKWKIKDASFKRTKVGGANIKDVIVQGLYDPTGNTNAGKEVEQYDKQGNLINVYPAASVASRETGIGASGIRAVCNGKAKTSGGYIWRWA